MKVISEKHEHTPTFANCEGTWDEMVEGVVSIHNGTCAGGRSISARTEGVGVRNPTHGVHLASRTIVSSHIQLAT